MEKKYICSSTKTGRKEDRTSNGREFQPTEAETKDDRRLTDGMMEHATGVMMRSEVDDDGTD